MFRKFYMALASTTIIGYSAMTLMGWELGSPQRSKLDAGSLRSSPGGYRSFHFWHTGFHGGK